MSERGSIFEGNKRHVFEKWLGVVRHAFEKLMRTKERQTKMLLFGVNVWQKRCVYDRITALVNRTRNIVASDTQYKQGYKKERNVDVYVLTKKTSVISLWLLAIPFHSIKFETFNTITCMEFKKSTNVRESTENHCPSSK